MIDDHVREACSRYHPYKSLPEYQIAGLLDKYGLPFIYEKPTAVVDNGNVRLWYPDFSLGYGPIIEYFGIKGDSHYDRRTEHKLNVYQANQYRVIPVYPSDMKGSWQDPLIRRIDRCLESGLKQYRAQTGREYGRPAKHSSSAYRRGR